MATNPYKVFTGNSADVINAIRNQASTNFREYVPVATPDAESIRAVGAIIMDNPNLQNEFIQALIGRIALVMTESKMYDNPMAIFKRGILDYGETIEEVFVDLIDVQQYDPDSAAEKWMRQAKPDVRSAFHVMNFQKFYKATIRHEQLRTAFLSVEGITDLVEKITEAMFKSSNYDEYLVMKYMLMRKLLLGQITSVNVGATPTSAEIVKQFKGYSNKLTFMSDAYNIAGVHNYSDKDSQYLFLDAQTDANIDVEVLASAFNMDKAEFMGHRFLLDSFSEFDTARLAEIFADDPNYVAISADDVTALQKVVGIILDKDWFMVWDKLIEMRDVPNGEGLYWQYWLHNWKIFSVSPFANAVAFTKGA